MQPGHVTLGLVSSSVSQTGVCRVRMSAVHCGVHTHQAPPHVNLKYPDRGVIYWTLGREGLRAGSSSDSWQDSSETDWLPAAGTCTVLQDMGSELLSG